MTDTPKDIGLVVDGTIAMVWLDSSIEAVLPTLPEGEHDLREYEAGTVLCGYDAETLAPPPAPPPPPPAQVPMHKVRKAARLTTWPGADHLLAAIETAIGQLPAPSNALAEIEFDYAPNLVREGATTLAVMAILGMTETQRDDLMTFAASLP